MDIHRFNNILAFEAFKYELAQCEFCAIDQEMTGIDMPGDTTRLVSDPEEVYCTKRNAVKAYEAFQFGIALFKKIENNAYESRPYNFYLLKRNGDVHLNMSTVSFLLKHNMDFQKWLKVGMSYCNAEDEAKLREPRSFDFLEEETSVCNKIYECVMRWYGSSDDEPLVVTEPCTYRCSRLIKNFIETQDIHVTVKLDGEPYFGDDVTFTFEKVNDTEWTEKKIMNEHRQELALRDVLGFRVYWKEIVKSGKPIVGHNFLHDLMFMIDMHEEMLPTSYSIFKTTALKLFPVIYDTKSLAITLGEEIIPKTDLSSLFQHLREKFLPRAGEFEATFRLPPGFYDYGDTFLYESQKAHEAGYDAYMTGVCFIYLRSLHGETYLQCKNMISAFGSLYYHCLDSEDKLVNQYTCVLKFSKETYQVDQVKALLYSIQENPEKSQPNSARALNRKHAYRVSSLKDIKHLKSNLFLVVPQNITDGKRLSEKISKLKLDNTCISGIKNMLWDMNIEYL